MRKARGSLSKNNPSLNPEIKSLFHTSLIFILLHRDLKSVTFGSNQNRWYGLAEGGDYEVASEMNDNYWPVSKAAKLELKKKLLEDKVV